MVQNSSKNNFVNEAAYVFLGACSAAIFLFVSFFVFLVVYPIRQAVKFILCHHYKDRFQLMEPTDAAICTDNNGSSMLMIGCFLAQVRFEKENLEKLREKLKNNIAPGNYKKLQLVPCTKFGFRCWEDVGTFDIQNHVKLCPGGDVWNRVYSETEFMSILNKAINIPITNGEKKPKWEVLMIPQVRAKTNSASSHQTHVTVIIRMCHGYMDGTCFIKFIQKCILDDEEMSFTPVLPPNINAWNFSRKATFYLKMFTFGIIKVIKYTCDEENNAFYNGTPTSEHTFIGKVKVTSESVRKIRAAGNCQTSTAVFSTAFAAALKNFGERKGIHTPDSIKIAFTRAVPGTLSNEKPQNRFALYVRRLPALELDTGNVKQLLSSTNDSIHLTPDKEYETTFNFYLTEFVGLLPDAGIRVICGILIKSSCLISLTPFSDQTFKFQGGLIPSFLAVPPYGYATRYSLGVSNYGGSFFATILVEKSSLVQSQHEFQELVCEFQDCLFLLEKYACET